MTETWCGFAAPFLGRCQCGDPANHAEGGIYYHKGRVPGAAITSISDTLDLFKGGGR